MQALEQTLKQLSKEGELYEKLPNGRVRCFACGHRCLISDGRSGVCRVRYNSGGKLYVPTGYVGALQLDPVEKKPFFHALPGSKAMSFGMLGCDYKCPFCQNFLTSQALRDPETGIPPQELTAEAFVRMAKQYNAKIVTSTYNEPLITSEWAVEIFKIAKSQGLVTSYVSNGNGTREVLEYIRPWVDLYKVDLKGFNDQNYRKLGGSLDNVLKTISMLHEMGFWLEIVTLVISGFNDSDDELKQIADFLVSISPDIPWHVTAFHKDYKMTDPDNTPAETLIHGAKIGLKAGLKFVYTGNLPGMVGDFENTYCPQCKELLIERYGFQVLRNRLGKEGKCQKCQTQIPGFWEKPER